MDLSDHMRCYTNAIMYFPNCFERDLHLKNDERLMGKIKRKLASYRKSKKCDYISILEGIDYIRKLQKDEYMIDKIRNLELRKLYFKYDDVVNNGFKNKNYDYNYLLMLSILRGSVLQILSSMDRLIECFPSDKRCSTICNFVVKWNLIFDNCDLEYSFTIIDSFLLELRNIGKETSFVNNVSLLNTSLERINSKKRILKK